MTELHEEFELRARLEADERRRIDFDDHQNELAGRESGRITRFLTAETHEARDGRSKRSEQSGERLSRLQQLLATNPAYAALYDDTFDKLRAAEAATEVALDKALDLHDRLQTARDDMLARAARLPDGTAVFRDDNGAVWSEHGDEVPDSHLDAIVWPENPPSYEAFHEATHALANADQKIDGLRGYQVEVLGHVRERMTDEHNPPSAEELRAMQSEINTQMPDLSGSANLDADNGSHTQPVAEIELPKL